MAEGVRDEGVAVPLIVGVGGFCPTGAGLPGDIADSVISIGFFGAVRTFQISLKTSFKLDIFDPAVDNMMLPLNIMKCYVLDHIKVLLLIISFLLLLYF